MNEMLKIVTSTIARKESMIFRDPVDHVALGLHDYPDIVKEPRDLGTIKSTIEKGNYDTLDAVAMDMRLVWSNCMLYNRDGSDYYHLADRFSKSFEDAYGALLRLEGGDKENKGRLPTAEERMQLSYDIFKIDNAEMGRTLTIIEDKCPSALVRKFDEVLINFDALSADCFNEVNEFVCKQLVQNGGHKKKQMITKKM